MPLSILASLAPVLTLPLYTRAAWRIWRTRSDGVPAGQGYPVGLWVPVLFGCGVVSCVVGQGISTLHQAAFHRALYFPSWADAGYLGAYPFLLGAILLLLLARRWRALPSRVLLDSLMTTAAVAPFSWYFALGPTIFDPHETTLAKLTGGGYTLCGPALLFGALLVWAQVGDPALHRLVAVLVPALTVIAVSDSLSVSQSLHHAAPLGELTSLTRSLGYLLLGLAGSHARFMPGRPAGASVTLPSLPSLSASKLGMRQVWRYLLPYALICAVLTLLASMGSAQADRRVEAGVYLAVAFLIELIFVHQFLAYRELIAYANRSVRLESLAGADPATGLPNHRTLVSTLDREIERSRRYGHPCVLLFLDLDHFKALNDTFGHPAGDAALREFSSVVRSSLRSIDTLGRWGGEEFVAILPETDEEAGLSVAERLRSAVAAHAFWSAGGSHITCSAGLASYPEHAQDRDGLIELADQAMYAAKRLGRNQVRLAGESVVSLQAAETRRPSSREEAALVSMVEALAALVNARDRYTGQHVDMVSGFAVRLALTLGLDTSQARLVGLAGRVHDIGKVAIPDAVLHKPTGLTEDEWTLMHAHPALGASVIGRVATLRVLAPIIRAHHERWDGRGYPDNLRGEAIPLTARILAVTDAFCAMTTERPYQRARDPGAAVAEVRRCSGTQFDPDVVEALEWLLATEPHLAQTAGVA